MRITARLTYGLGALLDLAAAGTPVKGEVLATRHDVSVGFLENILADLRRAGILHSKRGGHGGYWLARHPGEVTVADVIRALDGVRTVDTAIPDDQLLGVWNTITRAYIEAAESITLAAVVADAGDQPEP